MKLVEFAAVIGLTFVGDRGHSSTTLPVRSLPLLIFLKYALPSVCLAQDVQNRSSRLVRLGLGLVSSCCSGELDSHSGGTWVVSGSPFHTLRGGSMCAFESCSRHAHTAELPSAFG